MTADETRQPRRYFTVEEARALVPRLRGLLIALQTEKRQLDAAAQEALQLQWKARGNGHLPELVHRDIELYQLIQSIRQKIRAIHELGVEIKDLDLGLVDFPSLREGRAVYLCWKVDEPTVQYWHELDAGFQGRQPLEGP
jgi:hypothetical protein